MKTVTKIDVSQQEVKYLAIDEVLVNRMVRILAGAMSYNEYTAMLHEINKTTVYVELTKPGDESKEQPKEEEVKDD